MQTTITHSPQKTENRSSNEVKRYFDELQNSLSDNRDFRGQRHNLAFVLTSFLMSLLRCTGHVNLAMIHRRMIKEHELMVIETNFRAKKCVSYMPLGRILESIDYILKLLKFAKKYL